MKSKNKDGRLEVDLVSFATYCVDFNCTVRQVLSHFLTYNNEENVMFIKMLYISFCTCVSSYK